VTDLVADLGLVLEQMARPLPAGELTDLGSPSRTHVFVIDDIVAKFDARNRVGSGSMIRECAALELLAGTELAVPRLLHAGAFADGRRWTVLSRMRGEPPEDALRPAHELSVSLAAQMGAVIAALHAAPRPPAFGTWTLEPRRTYLDEHWHRIGILESMAREARVVADGELERLLVLLRQTAGALEDVVDPVLAHRDVQPRNVLVAEGELTALLDFESSAGGDPAEDFRVLGLDWSSAAFEAFARSYADEGGSLGSSGADRVAHYVLEWVLAIFAYLGRIAPAYLAPARSAVERIRDGERPKVD
jgi:aminoglycoside phosphotransferase